MIEYKPEYDTMGGEMLPFERRFLFDSIVKVKPHVVVEVGSGSAGSTRIILSALNQLQQGTLYNCDPYNIAATDVKDVDTSRMRFKQIVGSMLIAQLSNKGIMPDFIFFDGPEDADIVLNDFKQIESIVLPGTYFISHDWELRPRIDGNISIKSSSVRPYMHKSTQWEIIEELSGVNGEHPNNPGYNSVGMVYARKIL